MPRLKPTGIRLGRKKDASLLNWNLKRPYPPEKIRVPIPSDSLPCVRAGDAIHIGQKIAVPKPINWSKAEIGAAQFTAEEKKKENWAEAQGSWGVSVHAGIAGTVEKISAFLDAFGAESLMIEIRRHGEPKGAPAFELQKGWEDIPAKGLLWAFQHSGLVTTDPREEPVHAKLHRHAEARTIVINGCEPEPYVTCEQILMMSHPLEILKGAELLRKVCGGGAEKIVFALESPNLETIELIKSKIYFLKWKHVEVRTVPAFYPQGLEGMLLQEWFPGKENEAVVFPASTAFAAYEAAALQKPFFERVVTVGGECVVEPRSLWLPLGISFHDAIHACKGVMREPLKVLMGGPMAGTAQETAEAPVSAGTNAILALPKEIAAAAMEEPCIRCNRCADHCPVSLVPAMITLAAEQKEFSVAEEWNASDCMECGICGYVCPAKRPMLELIRLARASKRPAAPALIHGNGAENGAAAHG